MKLTKISLTLCIILLTSMAILALTQFASAADNTIQFVETGLPSGASWWVTYNSVTLYSTTNVITFTGVPDGTYSWSAQTTVAGTSDVQYVALVDTGSLDAPAAGPQFVNYTAQYRVTLASTNVGSDLGAGFVGTSNITGSTAGFTYSGVTGWVNSGDKLTFAYNSTLVVSPQVKQYVRLSVDTTSPATITAPTTITGDYKTQYYAMFNQTGLGNDFGTSTTVLTVNAVNYNRNAINFTSGGWFDSGATLTFTYTDPITATPANTKQYIIASVNATSPLTLTGRTTVLATYSPQYYVTFTATGVGSDYTATDVITVGASQFGRTGGSVWVTSNTAVTFTYNTPLSVAGKQYGLTGVNATSPLTITAKTTVTGSYSTQCYISITTTGIGSDYTANDVLTTNVTGTSTSYGKAGISGWYPSGIKVEFTFASPLTVNSGEQYTRTSTNATSVYTLSTGTTIMATYNGQYYLTVSSTRGVTSGQGWYNMGAQATFSVDQSVASSSTTQYGFDHWSGDSSSTSATDSITMDSAKSVTANWKTQYYIGVKSAHGQASGAGWYDDGANVTLGISSVDDVGGGVRYVFTSWSDGSTNPTTTLMSITKAQNLTASWKTQYYLKVISSEGSPTGAGWYDANSTANFAVTSPISGDEAGTQYVFTAWTGDSSATSPTASVVMSGPLTVTAHWKIQYFVTVDAGSKSASGEGWYDAGSTATLSVTSTDGFAGWLIDGALVGYDATLETPVNAPMNIEATWGAPTQGAFTTSTLILGGIIAGFVVVLVVLLLVLRKH